ncbi:MAG TPA: GNAT family protein [Motilibacteraceae bacterium]|nr:GNAT family protein [Motilibacteraceae bacterium]
MPTPVSAPDARPLVGDVVRLDLATEADAAELFEALDDERVWAAGHGGGPAGRPRDVEGTRRILETALAAHARGERVPYVVRLSADSPLGEAGTVVGTTSIGDLDLVNERAHVGWTAYGVPWWGTAVNAECKLLLLGHAFDDCGFGRIKIQTDAINARSQAAIAKLGATREGVLRRHLRRADGTFRDTVVFSVLRDEWPAVRAGLLARLSRTNP